MHLTDFVGSACIEQNSFSRGGFTSINVRNNSNVSNSIQRNFIAISARNLRYTSP